MSKVLVEYLQANGRYRKEMAHTESQWPNFLVNHRDRQAHSLTDSPVLYTDKSRRFYTWEELVNADPPDPIHFPDKPLCVCEDGSIWAVSNNDSLDVQDRQMQFKDFHQEAEQNAVAGAARLAMEDPQNKAWAIVSMAVFVVVAAVLVFMALQSQFVGDFIPGAAMVPFMLGMPLLKKGGPKEPKPKRPKFSQWETLRVYDEVAGFAWPCLMPLELLRANLPIDCRYTQEIGNTRWFGLCLFGGGVFIAGLMFAYAVGIPLLVAVVASLLISTPFTIFGWKKGYERFMDSPRWIVRRKYRRVYTDDAGEDVPIELATRERIDYDADPEIIFEPHTKLTGMPVDLAIQQRRVQAEEIARQAAGSQSQKAGPLSGLNLALAYSPRVLRAHMLYEFLIGRDVKSKMKGPEPKGDRIKQITRSGMAFGALAILAALIFFSN